MKSEIDQLEETAKRHERQDRANRETARVAEPLIDNLKPGLNYFTPDQYLAIVNYLYPYDQDTIRDNALSQGTHNVGQAITLKRVPWLTEDRLFSIQDISTELGINYRTLWGQLKKLNLPQKRKGGKILYDIDMLRTLLDQEN